MSAPLPAKVHFGGLDSLRFFAAFFVVIGHIPLNQEGVGLPNPNWGAFYFRGERAVAFFFALSGFLITYLLLQERARTGTIGVARFYLRRVCRIWPLYFLVVAVGLVFYKAVLPLIGIDRPVEYHLGVAIVLYLFFLPNLMNSLYNVGGILNPLWSIGIEEQFYLTWAPAVKKAGRRLPLVCGAILVLSLAVFLANQMEVFGGGWRRNFVGQLKFHYMAGGALCAWWLHRHGARFLALWPFRSRLAQAGLWLLLLDFYLAYFIKWGDIGDELVTLPLYCWLIVTVAANPRNLVPVGNRVLDYLGTISYGIYMVHMIAIHLTSFLFLRWRWWEGRPLAYFLAYYALALAATFLLAHFSFRWFESPFLRLKDRRFAALEEKPLPG